MVSEGILSCWGATDCIKPLQLADFRGIMGLDHRWTDEKWIKIQEQLGRYLIPGAGPSPSHSQS